MPPTHRICGCNMLSFHVASKRKLKAEKRGVPLARDVLASCTWLSSRDALKNKGGVCEHNPGGRRYFCVLAVWSSCGRRRLDSVLLRLPNFARLQSSPPPPRKITAYVAFSPSHPPFLHAKYTFTPMHLAIPCCLVVAEFVVYPVFLPITSYIVS